MSRSLPIATACIAPMAMTGLGTAWHKAPRPLLRPSAPTITFHRHT